MARYKEYSYSQTALIPVSLEEQIVPGTLEFAIHTLVETRMDLSIFDDKFKNDDTGRLAYDPKILLKIVLFGYSRGLTSSRKLESACKENIIFMAMACGSQPDHSTIAAFISAMRKEIMPLFRDILLVCDQENLLGGTFFALDGCKLPSNASSEYSGKISTIKQKKKKVEKRIKSLLDKHAEEDKKQNRKKSGRKSSGGKPPGGSAREKKIKKLKKQADRIKKWLKENSPKAGRRGRELSSNITDNESAAMVSSHGNIQGYNAQAMVDDKKQIIIHGEAFGDAQDTYLAPPVLDGAKENIKQIGHGEDYFKGTILTADSGYYGPPNINKCKEEKIDAYIPDKRFRQRDPELKVIYKKKPKNYGLEAFQHDQDIDQYICPNNKKLRRTAKNIHQGETVYRGYMAYEKDCAECKLKLKCTNGKHRHLNVPVGFVPGSMKEEMVKKLDCAAGKEIYSRRIGIVEPVFGNIRTQKNMSRFTLRGKTKVNIQWVLFCMVHNIEKILNYGLSCKVT